MGVSFTVDGTTYIAGARSLGCLAPAIRFRERRRRNGGTGVRFLLEQLQRCWGDVPHGRADRRHNLHCEFHNTVSARCGGFASGGRHGRSEPGWDLGFGWASNAADGLGFKRVSLFLHGRVLTAHRVVLPDVTMSGYRSVTASFTPISPGYTFVTMAGSTNAGSQNGNGGAAQFNFETGVASDSAGNVYVSDTYNSTIRKISPSGVVTTVAGSAGVPGSANGVGGAAQFLWPNGVAVGGDGTAYVADTYNNTIRKITRRGV